MAKIFITGSTEGLGYLAAKRLTDDGNEVVLHARNQQRADDVKKTLPDNKVVIGDLSKRAEVEGIAKQVNALGTFDTVIYNAGVDNVENNLTFKINVLAPYLLTALINRPKRIIYIDSSMHLGGQVDLNDLAATTDYSSSKFQILLLTKALARIWTDTTVTAVDPGWVPTRMGGKRAPDDLTKGYLTQVWLATLDDSSVSGTYYHHQKPAHYNHQVDDIELQAEYLKQMSEITGVTI